VLVFSFFGSFFLEETWKARKWIPVSGLFSFPTFVAVQYRDGKDACQFDRRFKKINSNKFLARFRKKNDVNVTVTKKYYLVPECSERVSHR